MGLSKESGVAQRTISNLLQAAESPEDSHSPRLATIEKVAAVFKIPAWQLMIPEISLEDLKSPDLDKLVKCWLASDDGGKENIVRVAENELRYSSLRDKK